MGWASASGMISDMALRFKQIPGFGPDQRRQVYALIIEMLNEGDWDTQDEAYGADEALDLALDEAGYGA